MCTNKLRKKTQSAFYTVVLLCGEVARQHKHLRDHVTEKVQEIVEPRTTVSTRSTERRKDRRKENPQNYLDTFLADHIAYRKKQLTQVPCIVKGKEKFTSDIRDF